MMNEMKQTLIIIHGWNSSLKSWMDFIELAKQNYDIHFVELPCFDNKLCPDEIWGIKDYADYVYKEIQGLTLEQKPIIIGHSFGGQIATHLVSEYTELASHLVLCGAAIIRPKHILKKTLFAPLVFISKILMYIPGFSILRKYAHKALGMHDYAQAKGVKREIFKKIIHEDLTHLLPKITLPTLILWGKRDTYTPLKHGLSIAKKISNSAIHIKDDGKHGLHINQPKWLIDKINIFLNNNK